MRKIFFVGLTLVIALLLISCSRQNTPTSPATSGTSLSSVSIDPELAAGEIVLASGWDFDTDAELPAGLAALFDKTNPGLILDFQREVIVGDIVHYSFILSVGPGEYDVIGLHRVVRETRPGRPIRARKSLFLVHGMSKDFVGNFLPGRKSPILPDDFGFAVFMAQNGVDVWGIDNSYTLVPVGPEDFSFAADWGMDKCVADIGTGISVARSVRLFTGNGYRKMILMGYSQGAIMGYAFLNGETQLPPGWRGISAFIPVDWGLGYDDPEVQQIECEFLGGYVELFNDGIYGFYDDPDGFYYSVGYLAQTEPDEPSPYFDGFTNLEVFLFFTTTAAPPNTVHNWAGIFDADGIPMDLAYTTPLMATEFWIHWAPMHPPTHLWADFYSINCEDSIWEDDLGDINMPVLSVEAAGGAGPGMSSTLDRLVHADVTRHVVQLLGPDEAILDFGHIDLFTAENAADLAWQPTLNWIKNLRRSGQLNLPAFADVLNSEKVNDLNSLDRRSPATGRYLGAPSGVDQATRSKKPNVGGTDSTRGRRELELLHR